MRILLDENLDWRLRCLPADHEVDSVAYIGWSGIKNLAERSGDTALDSLRGQGGGADETSKAVWRFASHRSPKGAATRSDVGKTG